MKEQRFRFLWRCIYKTWLKHPHCFLNGCGKTTMLWYIKDSCHILITESELRDALHTAWCRGWIEPTYQKNQCTKYRIKR